jgi:phosphatidylserine/phosphatidylglycerophosphate/cardiolipin synthase-like enzyme
MAKTTSYQVVGANDEAPFTFKVHRGDGMVLLAMNWRKGKPPPDFVGFAIEYREPGNDRFFVVKNRIGFPGQRKNSDDPKIPSTEAPIQKFRWVHFPRFAFTEGKFDYRVTPMFMNDKGELSRGLAQEVAVDLLRETLPGKLNVAFTRGYVSSQAFVDYYDLSESLSTLIPDESKEGIDFVPTHPKADKALEWMGFEAREIIRNLLDEAIKNKKAQVRVIAYDLNLSEILTRLEALGPRLKIIIDDSDHHGDRDSPESIAAERLRQSAGEDHVARQHMGDLQHHKSIAISGTGLYKLVYGSTNFTWRGFYVQSNNAIVVNGKHAVEDYFVVFDEYFAASRAEDFRGSAAAAGWRDLKIAGLDAKVAFSPHDAENGLLESIGEDIDSAKSCVLFSLAFLGQMKNGPIGPALGRKIKSKGVHTLGIADARVKEGNLGVEVMMPDDKKRVVRAAALTGNVPPPFSTEPSGLSGSSGHHRGTRMHHKFVVLDFDTDDARVYLGSYNFSEAADLKNGENLVLIKDRTVATSYMIEALRMYDHYRFRVAQEDAKKKNEGVVELKLPPSKPSDKPWWQKDWDDPIRKRDRELFA